MTTAWSYGDAGDRHPVRVGEVWAVGDHRLACVDLEEHAGDVARWAAEYSPTLCYVDPPWTPGNARAFRTKAGVDGEQGRAVDLAKLLARVIEAIPSTVREAWVEMGRDFRPMLERQLELVGWRVGPAYGITYYGSKRCHLVQAARPGYYGSWLDLEGADDADTPRMVMEARLSTAAVVFDPCCGRGLTATTAAQLGHRFIGTELAPRRMAVALDELAKITGQQPVLEGAPWAS